MKCVSLASNLAPMDPKTVLTYMKEKQRIKQGSAKLLIEEYAKAFEARNVESARISEVRVKCWKEYGVSKPEMEDACVARLNVEDRVATLGSEETIYSTEDLGLFASILMAYNNHWNLRSSPDDWWFCVIRRIAIAIDKNSKKDSVRKMFVDHAGKKTLGVQVPPTNVYDVNYTWFFNEMSRKISENVKVPEYVDAVTSNFSGTTAVQKIVSQITLMTSLQEFFDYNMKGGCEIPSMEMLGTEEDWNKLQSKLKVLRTLLEPIENDIELTAEWWALVQEVFRKLLATYRGEPDRDWWSRIVTYESFGSGPRGYTGWITRFTEGRKYHVDTPEFASGLVTVPLNISNIFGANDTAALVAGMLGFTLHEDGKSGVTSVQPFQGWSLLLPENSPFRHLSMDADKKQRN